MISLPEFIQADKGIPNRMLRKHTKMIIDTDGGGDDAHALLTAFTMAQKNGVEVVGVTCLNGNSVTSDGVKNVKIVQHMAGVSVPIYVGCDRNLKHKLTLSSGYFHQDGLCGHQQQYLDQFGITDFTAEPIHAVQFLVESAAKYKDDLVVVVIGPFTNIACALMRCNVFEKNVGQLICMAGNILGLGVMNDGMAEYNIHTDPEAAHLVFKVLCNKLVVVPYESVVTVAHDTVKHTFEQCNSVMGKFVKDVNAAMINTNNRYDVQDPLCVVLALQPDVVSRFVERSAFVILEGEGRGMLHVQWMVRDADAPKVTFVLKVDEERLLSMLAEVVK